MILYHTGFGEIKKPDIHFGRKNADFGQGFYLTPELSFAQRWAKERRGSLTYLNTYYLKTEGLNIKKYERSREWFEYIFANRHLAPDNLFEFDIIIGPIANDTIYDVLGVTTSGFLEKEEALRLLMIGPEYTQIALKTVKAVSQLEWVSSKLLDHETILSFRDTAVKEESEYQTLFAQEMLRG